MDRRMVMYCCHLFEQPAVETSRLYTMKGGQVTLWLCQLLLTMVVLSLIGQVSGKGVQQLRIGRSVTDDLEENDRDLNITTVQQSTPSEDATTASGKPSGCSGHFKADSGSIQYPVTASTYPNIANCSWIIISSGPSIELTFTRFNTERCCDFVYIRIGENSSAPLLGRYSGNVLPSKVRTTNKAFIRFTSDYDVSRPGFALTWNTIGSEKPSGCGGHYNADSGIIQYPLTTPMYPNNANCSWVIMSSGTSIGLTFTKISTEKCCDFVYIRDGKNINDPLLGRYSGNDLPSILTTTKKAIIQFTSDNSVTRTGFAMTWNTTASENPSRCGGHFIGDSGSIRYPVTADSYPNYANCSWVIVSSGPSIELTFTRFSTEECCDFVYVRIGENSSAPLLGRYSGSALPPRLRTTNKVFIHFTSNSSGTRPGFALTWNTIASRKPSGCGGNFKADSGIIQYPVTTSSYPNYANCSWVIVSFGTSIELTFTRFSTELSYDFVNIRNGENSSAPLLMRYSGSTLPPTVKTTTNKAFIHFTSDYSKTKAGFAFTWNAIGCPVNDGFFKAPGSDQCFKFFSEESNWAAADSKCKSQGLVLPKPKDPVALRKYLVDTHAGHYYWLDGRADGYVVRWQHDGRHELSSSSPLWWPGHPDNRLSTSHCLMLLGYESEMQSSPGRPYYSQNCSNTHTPLCAVIME